MTTAQRRNLARIAEAEKAETVNKSMSAEAGFCDKPPVKYNVTLVADNVSLEVASIDQYKIHQTINNLTGAAINEHAYNFSITVKAEEE